MMAGKASYAVLVLGLLLSSIYAAVVLRKDRNLHSLCRAMVPLAAMILAAAVLQQWLSLPFWDHNAGRLVGPFLLKSGYSLYPPRGVGPFHAAMIYPPLGSLMYWPSTWASTPTGAVLIGGALNLVYFFLPAALWLRAYGRTPKTPALGWGLGFLGFLCLTLNSEGLSYSAFRVHMDAPALLWATLSLALASSSLRGRIGFSTCAAMLATMTKQSLAPLWLLAPLWTYAEDGRKAFWIHAAWIAVSSGLLLLMGLHFASAERLAAYLISLPASYRFIGPPLESLLLSLADFSKQVWPVGVLAVGVFLADGHKKIPQPMRALLFASLVTFPVAVIHRAKIGGDTNSFVPPFYWLTLATLVGMAQLAARERIARGMLAGIVALGMLQASPQLSYRRFAGLWQLLPRNPQETSFLYEKSHPGVCYFPFNPLATLMSEGRLYHYGASLVDLELSGETLPPEKILPGLPPSARRIAIHRTNDQDRESLFRLLNVHSPPGTDPDLPGWQIYAF